MGKICANKTFLIASLRVNVFQIIICMKSVKKECVNVLLETEQVLHLIPLVCCTLQHIKHHKVLTLYSIYGDNHENQFVFHELFSLIICLHYNISLNQPKFISPPNHQGKFKQCLMRRKNQNCPSHHQKHAI